MTRVGRTSVIVVNWNAGPDLGRCLAALAEDVRAGADVVLVDNASTDGSTAAATAVAPWVRVLPQATNLGFAAGANCGAAAARGDVLVFLNPDAVLDPGALATLVDGLEQTGAAIAGAGLRHPDGRWQPGAARFAPAAHLLLDTTIGRWPDRWRRAPYRVDWVYGTVMAVRADVFRALDGFDVRYFCYGEDLDLCHRAHAAGYRIVQVPGARALHGHNVCATQRFGGARDAEVVRAELRFYARRLGADAAARYRTLAQWKFGLKRQWHRLRGQAEAAAGCAAILAACRESAGDHG